MTSAAPSDALAAMLEAWRLRARQQAAVRLAERQLGRRRRAGHLMDRDGADPALDQQGGGRVDNPVLDLSALALAQ